MKVTGRRLSKNVRIGNTKKTSRGTRKVKPSLDVSEVSRDVQEKLLTDYQRAHGWVTDEAQHAARSGYHWMDPGPRRGSRAVKNVARSLSEMYERKLRK